MHEFGRMIIRPLLFSLGELAVDEHFVQGLYDEKYWIFVSKKRVARKHDATICVFLPLSHQILCHLKHRPERNWSGKKVSGRRCPEEPYSVAFRQEPFSS